MPDTRNARLLVMIVMTALAVACNMNADAKKRKYFELGDKYVSEKKYPEAIVAYRNAINIDERFGEARNHLGKAYLGVNDPKNALGELVRAADLLPNDTAAQLDAAKILILVHQYDDARARADAAVKRDPKNIEAYLTRAIATAALRDFTAATADVNHAIQLDPTRGAAYVQLGRIQAMQGNYADAERTFKEALAKDPKSVDANLALAGVYWGTNRRADAEQFIKHALAVEPRNASANRTLASLYLASNRAQEAEAPLRTFAETGDASAKLDLADYYVGQRRVDDARKVLNDLATKPDGFAPATTKLAEIEYANGSKDKAHALVDSVLAKQPNNPRALVLKGQWLLNERKMDDALARAQAAVKAAPQYADAQFLLGSVYAQRGDREKALTAYREVVRLNPNAANAVKAIAALDLDAGRREEALKFAEEAARAQPNDIPAQLLLTRVLILNGQVDRARTELQKVMPRAQNVAEAHVLMGHVQRAQKNTAGARQSYERAYSLDPKSVEALTSLVQSDVDAKRLDVAQRRVDEALTRTPNDPRVMLLAARASATKGDNARAETLLKKAIQVDPSFMQAYGVLGQLYVQQGKLDQARAEFQQIANKRPDDLGAATMVGMILERQGKKNEAKKAYENVYDRNPKAAVAANNLAFLLAEEGTNLDRALNLAQSAKAQMPDDPNVSDTLGWVYYKKGLAGLAIDSLDFSVTKDPSRAAFQYHLGFAYLKAGDKENGKMWLERALKLQPDSDMAAEARKSLAS